MKKSKVFISLTGGLGNQLFQLAAGLNLAKGSDLYLKISFGKPRKNNKGEIELSSFTLPDNVFVENTDKAPYFIAKIAGYLLRVGVAPRFIEKYELISKVIVGLSNIPLSIYLKERVSVVYSKNLGYSRINLKNKTNLVFGYFQTCYWVENPNVKNIMMNLMLRENVQDLELYKILADVEKPLIVHVRLGDYILEDNFGTLSEGYYRQSIEQILESGKCKSIWLFSDEIEKSEKLLPSDVNVPIRLFGDLNQSTAVTFQIMRLGHGYVIANSTFSWWAAYLAINQNVQIICPKPWFKGMSEPIGLIPTNWHRIEGNIFTTTSLR